MGSPWFYIPGWEKARGPEIIPGRKNQTNERSMKMNRMKNRVVAKGLVCYLVLAILVIGMAEKSYAGFSPSEVVNLSPLDRSADLIKIRAALEIKVVSDKLAQLGFDKNEIQARIGQLSDQQLHKIALKTDELRVGGDGAGLVIAILVIAILAVLFVFLLKRV
jgi:hypothetical protein